MIQLWLMRNAAWVVISVAIIGIGFWVGHSRNEIRPALDSALAERDNILSALENERAARLKAEEAISAYSKELQSIRRRVNSTPVRVCFDETAPVPATADTASDSDAATSQTGRISGAPRGDLAALRELAFQCDAVSARLRALQQWAMNTVLRFCPPAEEPIVSKCGPMRPYTRCWT
jgi:hypothetical protein